MRPRAPKVSVVIPMFNRAATIRRAVGSVLAQTFPDFEVLVVDDASTDASPQMVETFGDARVRLVRRDRNGGAAAARNTGVRESQGAFVAFLDSDDEWLPRKLEIQVPALEGAPADAAVSCTGVEMHLLDHGVTRDQPLEEVADWSRRLAMDCDLSPGTTQLAHRRVFDEVGLLDERFPRFEDWEWLIRYTRRGRITAVREPLARVFNRRGRLGDVVERSAALLLDQHRDVFTSLSGADRREAMANIWLQVVGTYAFEGNLKAAIRPAAMAFALRPLHVTTRLMSGAAAVVRGRAMRRDTPISG